MKMKLTTINQIVEAILSQNDDKAKLERSANEVTIALKMAMICESRGIEEAMDYYNKTHGPYEYLEYRTNVTKSDDISLCKDCWCMTRTINGKCGKCSTRKGQ